MDSTWACMHQPKRAPRLGTGEAYPTAAAVVPLLLSGHCKYNCRSLQKLHCSRLKMRTDSTTPRALKCPVYVIMMLRLQNAWRAQVHFSTAPPLPKTRDSTTSLAQSCQQNQTRLRTLAQAQESDVKARLPLCLPCSEEETRLQLAVTALRTRC